MTCDRTPAIGEKMKLHYIKASLTGEKMCMSPRFFGGRPRMSRPCLPGLRYSRALVLGLFLNFIGSPLVPTADPGLAATAPDTSPAARQMEQGLSSFQRGNFEQAVVSWTEAARLYEAEQKPREQTIALIHLAQAYQSLGQYKDALKNLEAALALAEKSGDRRQIALALGTIGDVYIATGPEETALKYLNDGLRIAREANDQDISAIILNNLGNLFTAQKKYPEAVAAYTESASLAKSRNHPLLVARALTNAATASIQNKQYKEANALLDSALVEIR